MAIKIKLIYETLLSNFLLDSDNQAFTVSVLYRFYIPGNMINMVKNTEF